MIDRRAFTLSWGRQELSMGKRTLVMGIVNVTPDSFSDGGKFFDQDAAVSHGLKMAVAGADILDIGGESTRPFSDPVSVDEELRRIIPVIERLVAKTDVPISVDTMKAVVAEKALDAGASMLNDVSALRFDPDMAKLAADRDVPLMLMHMLGSPKTMQVSPEYDDVVKDIIAFLENAVTQAVKEGVSHSRLIIDPGIGFGKTMDHNLEILCRLSEFSELKLPILIGASRKAFIRKILSADLPKELSAGSPEVEIGSQAIVTASVLNGAHIVRVHNVENSKATVQIADRLMQIRRGDSVGE